MAYEFRLQFVVPEDAPSGAQGKSLAARLRLPTDHVSVRLVVFERIWVDRLFFFVTNKASGYSDEMMPRMISYRVTRRLAVGRHDASEIDR